MTRSWSIGGIAFRILVVLIAGFLLLPTIIIIPISFTPGNTVAFPPGGFSLRWYEAVFHDPAWIAAMTSRLKIAVMTVVLSVVMGTAAAVGLFRGNFPMKTIVRGLVLSPLMTPVIVLAIGTFMVFARWGLAGTYAGLVIAHTVLALPFVIVSVTASLHTLNANLELASLGLGAGRADLLPRDAAADPSRRLVGRALRLHHLVRRDCRRSSSPARLSRRCRCRSVDTCAPNSAPPSPRSAPCSSPFRSRWPPPLLPQREVMTTKSEAAALAIDGIRRATAPSPPSRTSRSSSPRASS